jgi:hypothetical protein
MGIVLAMTGVTWFSHLVWYDDLQTGTGPSRSGPKPSIPPRPILHTFAVSLPKIECALFKSIFIVPTDADT